MCHTIEEVSQNFGVGEIFGHVRGEMLNNSQRGDICMQVGGAGLFLTTWLPRQIDDDHHLPH